MINLVARWKGKVEVEFIVARSYRATYNATKHNPHQTINQCVCRAMRLPYRTLKINKNSLIEVAELLSVTTASALDRELIFKTTTISTNLLSAILQTILPSDKSRTN